MMYDDVADSNSNPVKGTLINRPGGQDVYQGVIKVRCFVFGRSFVFVRSFVRLFVHFSFKFDLTTVIDVRGAGRDRDLICIL